MTRSLNGLLEHPWPEQNDFGRGYNHAIDLVKDVLQQRGEISVKSLPLDIWEAALDDGTLLKNYDLKEVLYKLIRAARRNPEPVSVSLEKCAAQVFKTNPTLLTTPYSRRIAKTVLDTAGVKYVD